MQSNEKVKLPMMWLGVALLLTFVRAFALVGVGLLALASAYSYVVLENVNNPQLAIYAALCLLVYAIASWLFFKLPID